MQTAGCHPPIARSKPHRLIKQGGSSHTQDAKRKFVTAVYRMTADGVVADVPKHCPFGGDGKECRVHRHDWRSRGFGPGHPLRIVWCVTHSHAFTLYPPGWFPYSRRPVAVRSRDWTKTIFVAAVCAAAEELWPEERAGEYGHRATPQRRFIEACGHWLGLDRSLRQGESVAELLGVPLAAYATSQEQWADAVGRVQRGRVIRDLLAAVPDADDRLVTRMLRVVIRGRYEWFNDRSGVRKPA